MEPYKVLLVDDEDDIRLGISHRMDWGSLGFTLVGEAENGQEAFELACQLHPDVVLTDIRMPFLDGLELCRLLKERLPSAHIVLFSGFEDFEYAQRAIHMNVFEYILKPINAAELSEVMQKLHDQIDKERTQLRDIAQLKARYEGSLPLLRELFFTQLFNGMLTRERAEVLMREYSISLPGASFVSALISFSSSDTPEDAPLTLQALSIQELFLEHFHLAGCSCIPVIYDNTIALVAGLASETPIYQFITETTRVCRLAKSYLNLDLTVGIGNPTTKLNNLHLSMAEARNALDYRALLGSKYTIYIADMEPFHVQQLSFSSDYERDLLSAIKTGDKQALRTSVSDIVEKLRQVGPSLTTGQLFFLELLTALIRLVRTCELDQTIVFGKDFTGMLQITDFSSPEALGDWCLERCMAILDLLGRQRVDAAWRTMEKAKTYIESNYANPDLSVDHLCDHLHLSSAYFSTLFKRETGENFVAYLTSLRMRRAAELLKTTEDKTYIVAEKTGYSDPNYFSYVFKRYFGISPTKYRLG